MTFNRFYVGSKYPYFISYRGNGCIFFAAAVCGVRIEPDLQVDMIDDYSVNRIELGGSITINTSQDMRQNS